MTPSLDKVSGVTAEDLSRLRALGIRDADALWDAVGNDHDAGIDAVAARAKIDAAHLAAILEALALAEEAAAPSRRRSLRLEFLLALLAVGFGVVVFRPATRTVVIVRSTAGLRPYQIIGKDDLAVETRPRVTESIARPDAVVGRYALELVPSGAVLRSSQVSARAIDPALLLGRDAVSIDAERMAPPLAAGERVSLYLATSGDAPRSAFVPDALVLAVRPAGDRFSVAFAICRGEIMALAPLLGNARVFVMRAAGSPAAAASRPEPRGAAVRTSSGGEKSDESSLSACGRDTPSVQ
jgi:hypothetical protein